MGTSAPAILSTGASRYSKLSSTTVMLQRRHVSAHYEGAETEKTQRGKETDHISAPTPCCGKASSTVTNLLVFLTDALIAALSSGLIERRLIT
jgi:hypothetical protein